MIRMVELLETPKDTHIRSLIRTDIEQNGAHTLKTG